MLASSFVLRYYDPIQKQPFGIKVELQADHCHCGQHTIALVAEPVQSLPDYLCNEEGVALGVRVYSVDHLLGCIAATGDLNELSNLP